MSSHFTENIQTVVLVLKYFLNLFSDTQKHKIITIMTV